MDLPFYLYIGNQYDKIYIIDYQYIEQFLQTNKSQIPFDFFVENGYELKQGYNPILDYIKYIDTIIEKR